LASDLLRKLWLLEALEADDLWVKEDPYPGSKEVFEAASSWEQ
jgi:hypothetical protein